MSGKNKSPQNDKKKMSSNSHHAKATNWWVFKSHQNNEFRPVYYLHLQIKFLSSDGNGTYECQVSNLSINIQFRYNLFLIVNQTEFCLVNNQKENRHYTIVLLSIWKEL